MAPRAPYLVAYQFSCSLQHSRLFNYGCVPVFLYICRFSNFSLIVLVFADTLLLFRSERVFHPGSCITPIMTFRSQPEDCAGMRMKTCR